MADKSFEQRVKDELGSLTMRPGAEVWTKVEAGLHKEKKRRWMAWLFLFAGLAAASAIGYLVWEPADRQQVTEKTNLQRTGRQGSTTTLQGEKTITDQHTAKVTATAPVEIINEKITGVEASKALPGTEVVGKNKLLTLEQSKTKNKPAQTFVNVSTSEQKSRAVENPVANNAGAVLRDEVKSNGTITGNPVEAASKKTDAEKTNTLQDLLLEKKEMQDTAAVLQIDLTPAPQEKSTTPLSPGDSAEPTQQDAAKKEVQKNKWQFSVNIDAGVSSLRDRLFTPTGRVFGGSNFTNAPNPAVPGAVATNAPALADAFGFGIALEGGRQLNKTFRLAAIAGYRLFQTATSIGRRIDSTAFFQSQNSFNANGYYYTGSDSIRYTNRYHFVTLGAELQGSFTLFKKLPGRWKIGGGANFLVGSNGLHYDEISGRSFQNNDLLTRVQPYVSGGFDFAIGRKPFMYVGPRLQYHLGHLNKAATSGDHLLMTSLQFSFLLSKNKK